MMRILATLALIVLTGAPGARAGTTPSVLIAARKACLQYHRSAPTQSGVVTLSSLAANLRVDITFMSKLISLTPPKTDLTRSLWKAAVDRWLHADQTLLTFERREGVSRLIHPA